MTFIETKSYYNPIDGSISIHSDEQNEFMRRLITIPLSSTNLSVWLDARREDLRSLRDYIVSKMEFLLITPDVSLIMIVPPSI